MMQAILPVCLKLAFLMLLVLHFLLLIVLFKVIYFVFVHFPILSSYNVKLVLVRAMITTNQWLLLNGSVLFFYLNLSVKLLIWLPAIHMNISELLDLLLVSFVVIILKHINFLGVCEVNNLLHCLLSLDLKTHQSFLLLVHDHRDNFNKLVSNRLVLLPLLDLNWRLLRIFNDATWLQSNLRLFNVHWEVLWFLNLVWSCHNFFRSLQLDFRFRCNIYFYFFLFFLSDTVLLGLDVSWINIIIIFYLVLSLFLLLFVYFKCIFFF